MATQRQNLHQNSARKTIFATRERTRGDLELSSGDEQRTECGVVRGESAAVSVIK